MGERDPLSTAYDTAVRRALLRAIRAHYAGQAATAFIASPGHEFRNTDRGGRTAHERAFTRSAYYQVWKAPQRAGQVPQWSLKLTWGPIERRGDRYGRTVTIRLYTRGAGVRHNNRHPGRSWAGNPALQSHTGARIDE